MVLKILTNMGVLAYQDIDRTFFRRRCAGGMKYLQFDISTRHQLYSFLHLEGRVEYLNDYYVIKGIHSRTKARVCTVNCELDLDGLDSQKLTKTLTTVTFNHACRHILRNTGWQIIDADLVSRRTTLELVDNTPREALEKCTNKTVFGTCYEYDTKGKTITCIKPYNNTTPTGTYFTDELNLDDLTKKGSSAGLVTKLYAYGKDGLSFADINDGKEFIENYSYTDRIIVGVWRDERYTDKISLLEDTQAKLEVACKPEISYALKVIDLAKINPERYGRQLKYDLYDVVTLIDRDSKVRNDLRIVELVEYPADHTLDTIVISNVTNRITGKISSLSSRVIELDAQQLHDRTKVNEIKQDLETTVLHVAESWSGSENNSWFTQTSEGLFFEVTKIAGTQCWGTLLQQSYKDIMISWNSYSDYIKFENVNGIAQINFYNNPKNTDSQIPILSLNKNGEQIYDVNGSLLMRLHSSGQDFYYKNNWVGRIGTTGYNDDESKRGLVFNLTNEAAYMAWCHNDSYSEPGYNMKWAYVSPHVNLGPFSGGEAYYTSEGQKIYVGSLHAGCPVDMHNWSFKNWAFEGGGFTGSATFQLPVVINSAGEIQSWRSVKFTFKNGILQSADNFGSD